MIKNRSLLPLLFILCMFFICTNAPAQIQNIYLNPKAAGSEKQSEFADSIRFIPLELKEGMNVGEYSNVTVTPDHFLAIDYTQKAVLLYSREGRFIRRIDYQKLAGDFYPSYNQQTNQLLFFGDNKNYTLTRKDRIKIKLDWSNPRNKKYYKKYTIDLADTTFAFKKEQPTLNDINQAYHFYDDYYWQGNINTSPLYKDSLDYELKIYRDNQLVKQYFPYNRINEPRFLYTEAGTQFHKTDTADVHLVTRPFCDTIYRMVKDSLFAAYHLVLPMENSLPSSFFSKPFKNKTERENFERNNGWMLRQLHSVYETERFVFLIVGYLSNTEAYLYQKQTGNTYKAKNIRPDSSQYNLSLLADFGFERKDGRFYKTQKAGDLSAFFEQHPSVPVPKELEAFLNGKPHGDSPVIVEFKLKN